jgi:hypothetical protein
MVMACVSAVTPFAAAAWRKSGCAVAAEIARCRDSSGLANERIGSVCKANPAKSTEFVTSGVNIRSVLPKPLSDHGFMRDHAMELVNP